MELRLLSADVDDLVDPDVDTIRGVLTKLPELSGDKPPRAVLVHDNGKDFIQFFAVFGKEITTRRPTEFCYLEYCQYSGDNPDCFFSEELDFSQVIELFQLYASREEEWKRGINWTIRKPSRTQRQINLCMGCFAAGIISCFFGILLVTLNITVAGFLLIIVGLLGFSSFYWPLLAANAGEPWTTPIEGSSYGGGGCASGSCGSCGSGDGGGGGCGGGCGGGGE